MSPRVVVLDYGSGNLRSACRALETTGAEVTLTADIAVAEAADGLVVPGVGAYASCMAGLRGIGGDEVVRARAAAGRPVLGICVGFQVLFDEGHEHGVRTAGCGVLPGMVERLTARRLPHMGWNTVAPPADSVLFDRVAQQWFYFVHSYGVHAPAGTDGRVAATWTEHEDDRFVAAVEQGCVSGTQFHPEKSGRAGLALLGNWVGSLQR
ncbi:MAG: imidazole glycerol phosphate synthase subunit HisH [Propionibacteriaceae bacterium]|nr:imidazole glycerol phosphate synthase subunit HisH [Propionibacteriaceae bacterium]